jgi:hypothetical protein
MRGKQKSGTPEGGREVARRDQRGPARTSRDEGVRTGRTPNDTKRKNEGEATVRCSRHVPWTTSGPHGRGGGHYPTGEVHVRQRATLKAHDEDGNRDNHDSEDRKEEVRLEEWLPQAPFGARLDDVPHVRPSDCSASIHPASRERTPARMLRLPR